MYDYDRAENESGDDPLGDTVISLTDYDFTDKKVHKIIQRTLSNVDQGTVTLEFSFTPKPGFVAPTGTAKVSTPAGNAEFKEKKDETQIENSYKDVNKNEVENENTFNDMKADITSLKEKLQEAEGKVQTSQELIIRLEREIDSLKNALETQRKDTEAPAPAPAPDPVVNSEKINAFKETNEIEELKKKPKQVQSELKNAKKENETLSNRNLV